jgi:hypothetical protein
LDIENGAPRCTAVCKHTSCQGKRDQEKVRIDSERILTRDKA